MLERRAELGQGVRPESIPDRLSAQRHRLSLVEGDVDGAVIAAVDVQVALLADLLLIFWPISWPMSWGCVMALSLCSGWQIAAAASWENAFITA